MLMLAAARLVLVAALVLAAPSSLLSGCGSAATDAPSSRATTASAASSARVSAAPRAATTSASAAASTECDENRWHDANVARICETRTFSLSGGTLTLNAAPNGGISVTTWDRDAIEVEAHVEAWAETEADAQRVLGRVEIEHSNQRLRTRLPDDGDRRNGRRHEGASVSYELRVPRGADLDLETVNGGINVDGVVGSLQLSSVNGGISLTRVGGRISGQTVNGPVVAELTETPTGGLTLTTTNGPVTLDVPGGLSAEVDARTSMGPVRVEGLPLEDDACKDREDRYAPCMSGRVVGTLGRGGPALRLRTTNGPISLRAR